MTGRVLEIREFCLHDGPGPRTTVFLQGCPLRCTWCQNPEGQDLEGGRPMTVEDVVSEIGRTEDFLRAAGGGVTFSGGEPLAQAPFLLEIANHLTLPLAVETSGYASPPVYRAVAERMDLILQDIKFPTTEGYRLWTGLSAETIFENFAWLKASGRPFIVRMPLLPGVNDDEGTKHAVAELLRGAKNLVGVELLPYNPLAGAKYAKMGRAYAPGFDEQKTPNLETEAFTILGLPCRVM